MRSASSRRKSTTCSVRPMDRPSQPQAVIMGHRIVTDVGSRSAAQAERVARYSVATKANTSTSRRFVSTTVRRTMPRMPLRMPSALRAIPLANPRYRMPIGRSCNCVRTIKKLIVFFSVRNYFRTFAPRNRNLCAGQAARHIAEMLTFLLYV